MYYFCGSYGYHGRKDDDGASHFEMKAPESIGPTDKSRWFKSIQCSWEEQENGNWSGHGWVKGEIDYTIDVQIGDDYVDFIIKLTNKSDEAWSETQAFNCFSNRYTPLRYVTLNANVTG